MFEMEHFYFTRRRKKKKISYTNNCKQVIREKLLTDSISYLQESKKTSRQADKVSQTKYKMLASHDMEICRLKR